MAKDDAEMRWFIAQQGRGLLGACDPAGITITMGVVNLLCQATPTRATTAK
jgi:hypothetical protein